MVKIELPFFNTFKGGEVSPLLSDERAQLVQQINGRWYHASKQGKLFIGNSAAGGSVLPIFSNTAQVFGLWNPAGSGVNGILVGLRGTYVSTTGAAGGYCLGLTRNAGSALATGGISAFTETAPERGLLGSNVGGNKIRFTASAATVLAPVIGRQLGQNQLVITATDATSPAYTFKEDFDGDVVLAPNTAIWLAGNIATLATYASSIMWVEEAA